MLLGLDLLDPAIEQLDTLSEEERRLGSDISCLEAEITFRKDKPQEALDILEHLNDSNQLNF
jgi:hypothetical protein